MEIYHQLSTKKFDSVEASNLLRQLEAYRAHDDWFVANRALILLALEQARHLNLTQALIAAQAGL